MSRHWRAAFTVSLVVWIPSALAAACSSSSTPPAELSSHDTGVPERATPEPTPEPPAPEPEPEPEVEAGCAPLFDGGVVVSMSSLTFGDAGMVGCGTQATPQTLTISNDTCDPIDFTNALTSGGSYYSVSPPTGTIPPHLTQNVTINPNPIPQVSAVTPDLYEGTLSITTTAQGDSAHIIQLHMTAYGAIITSTQFGQTLNFNNEPIGGTSTAQFSVINNGNAPTVVSFAVGSQFYSVTAPDGGAASFTIPANQSVAPVVKFSPKAVQPYPDTVTTTVATTPPLCAAPPATIPISGNGSTGVGVSPVSLAFGQIPCGSLPPKYQVVTINNTGAAITYTPTLQNNTAYTLADDATTNPLPSGQPVALGAASTANVRVIPLPIPKPALTTPNGYYDKLTITTTGLGDSPHSIDLNETALGTIFTLTPTSLTPSSTSGNTVLAFYQVQNVGNQAGSYTLTVNMTQGPAGTFVPNLTTNTLPAAPSPADQGTLSCKATVPPEGGTTQFLGNLSLAANAGTVLCANPPPPITLILTTSP